MAAGWHHTVVVTDDEVYAWGSNSVSYLYGMHLLLLLDLVCSVANGGVMAALIGRVAAFIHPLVGCCLFLCSWPQVEPEHA